MSRARHRIGPGTGRWTLRRRAVQGGVAVLFAGLPFAVAAGLRAVDGSLAALALGPVDLVEPSGALSAVLAAGSVTAALALGVLPWILVALLLGPVFCSWLCPWGLASELLDRLRRRARRPWPADGFRRLRWPRIALFAGLMLLSVLAAAPVVALLSPPRLMTTLPIEAVVLGALSPVTVGLLIALLALELAGPRRLWCRALCPVGTGFKLLRLPGRAGSGPAGLTVRWNESACTCPGVPACQTRCAWGIDPRRMETYDGCTHCFACVDGCPTGALAPAFGTPGHSSRRSSQSLQNAQPVVRRPSNDGPRGGDR